MFRQGGSPLDPLPWTPSPPPPPAQASPWGGGVHVCFSCCLVYVTEGLAMCTSATRMAILNGILAIFSMGLQTWGVEGG